MGDEKLFRVRIALDELYKQGEAIVLIGDTFHAVGNMLDCLKIEYKFEASNENYNRIYL
ncbi:hypothetical protein [uncultured Planococcus sp.]|uniref:hypothetical protein n=1 Tax=uncultured Planococcus sp. TaxID=337815 RepID=UPI002607AAD4|nr:hypothetical protein [uncultured Planococcus sp.]